MLGYIIPLDLQFKKQWDDYIDILLDSLNYNGDYYGLPSDWNDAIIFYNKDLFDEVGIPYPSEDWTTEDFVRIAKQLTKDTNGDGNIDQFGYLVTGDWFDSMAPWISTFGGSILNEDWTESRLDRSGSIAGLKFMNDLVNKYKVAPNPAVMRQMGGSQYFMTGKVAMAHYGRYMVPAFRKANFNWDVQHQPYGPAGERGVPYGVGALCVSSQTKYPEAAFKFVQFFSSPEAVKILNEAGNSIPVLESVVNQPDFKHPKLAPQHQGRMIEAVEYAKLIPSPPGNSEIINKAVSMINTMLVQNIPPEEVAKKLSAEVDKILQSTK